MNVRQLTEFLKESLMIEGIRRVPSAEEVQITQYFLDLPELTVEDVCNITKVYQPNALLRDKPGLNVKVGIHYPIPGGPEVRIRLTKLLRELTLKTYVNDTAINPFEAHCEYEILHPFTDGNGRSGRAVWLWQMLKLGRGTHRSFLHSFYYQTLDAAR